MIVAIAHINLIIPPGTLDAAEAFYGKTLGLQRVPVPVLQKDTLAWFNLPSASDSTPPQQVHIAFGPPESDSARHPCFRLASPEALAELQARVWAHYETGGAAAPRAADQPGAENSGAKGVEYPTRFFARDYAGNRLEFSL